MARRVIGLDVGTHAVTVAAVSPGAPPRLDLFGQVTLARGAMREGEVVDDLAVTDAVGRLRDQLSLKREPVRLGMASPRLIVRQIEMPVMSRDELAGAIRFQAGDLIPIPIDEAALDFSILGTVTPDDGEPFMRVLLAAAQQMSVMRLVGAVEAAGLPVVAVDLIPLALIRALARPVSAGGVAAEGIVSFGGGVTSIAVHEDGIPRFVRVLGIGGRGLTDTIATDLDIPHETAESLKRQLTTAQDASADQARGTLERPLGVMIEEVRSSIDYYRNQPGAVALDRIVVTGGASQLPGIAQRLATLTGLPVDYARPRDALVVGDIGFDAADYGRLDPNLAAAAGLALGGLGVGTVIDLLPRQRRARVQERSRYVGIGAAAAAAALVLLGIPTLLQHQQLSSKKSDRAEAQAVNAQLEADIATLQPQAQAAADVASLRQQIDGLLATDVSWASVLTNISHQIPANVWLTGLQGTLQNTGTPGAVVEPTTPPGDTTPPGETPPDAAGGATDANGAPLVPAGPTGISGTISWDATGENYAAVVAWIRSISDDPEFADLWVATAERNSFKERPVVTFQSTAAITDAAKSNRSEYYTGGSK